MFSLISHDENDGVIISFCLLVNIIEQIHSVAPGAWSQSAGQLPSLRTIDICHFCHILIIMLFSWSILSSFVKWWSKFLTDAFDHKVTKQSLPFFQRENNYTSRLVACSRKEWTKHLHWDWTTVKQRDVADKDSILIRIIRLDNRGIANQYVRYESRWEWCKPSHIRARLSSYSWIHGGRSWCISDHILLSYWVVARATDDREPSHSNADLCFAEREERRQLAVVSLVGTYGHRRAVSTVYRRPRRVSIN